MELDSLRPMASGLAGALAVYLLARASRKPARRTGSTRVLEFGRGFRIFAALLIPASAFVAYAAAHARPSQAVLAVVIATIFTLVALYLALLAFCVTLEYDEQNLYCKSLFSRKQTVPWTDVRAVGYSSLVQAHYIESAKAKRIWVSSMMQGFEEFGEFLLRKHGELQRQPG